MTSLLVDVVRREPLAAADGRSGSLLERVVLAGGEALVVKHVRAGGDWIMRATHDRGRAAQLWSSGVLARVPEVIDHAVVGAEPVAGGWVVVMRDVASALVGDHARLARDDPAEAWARGLLAQGAFWGPVPATDGIRRCRELLEQAAGNRRSELTALQSEAGSSLGSEIALPQIAAIARLARIPLRVSVEGCARSRAAHGFRDPMT